MSVHIHHFKIHPEPFEQIVLGSKRHEIRKDDRGTRPRPGDLLVLREWRPLYAPGEVVEYRKDDGPPPLAALGDYTGREVKKRVTYVSEPGTWGLPPDLYVMSIS